MNDTPIGRYRTSKGHLVVVDGRPRLTCITCYGSNDGVACLKQPYMTAEQWNAATTEFQKLHGTIDPSTKREF